MELCLSCGEMIQEGSLTGDICQHCFESINKKKEEKEYENPQLQDFSEEILDLKKKLKEDTENPLAYYFLAKEYILKIPLRLIDSLKEVEDLLKKSLELGPDLWAPKIFLGELFFKQGKFLDAEPYFRKAMEEKPESVSIKEYLAKCIENKEEKYSEKDLLYLLENKLREFIKIVLEKEFKDDWWREGIPEKIRSDCVSKRERGLKEEKDIEPMLFANFYDYKAILHQNKNLFCQFLDVKEWCSKLNELEPIRNVVAHNRELKGAFEKIKSCYDDLKRVLEKYGK
jgi:tetratricopeptide (TPR) repeat protein